MTDDWKTPSQPRLIGHLSDAHGRSVALSVDRGDVLIRHLGTSMRLSAKERDLFGRIYMEAERQAEAWAADVVDAFIWCQLDGGCLQGPPSSHLFGPSCVTEAEATGDG